MKVPAATSVNEQHMCKSIIMDFPVFLSCSLPHLEGLPPFHSIYLLVVFLYFEDGTLVSDELLFWGFQNSQHKEF